ncbi:MAG: ABC transporter ATP-binding protein [Actinomycetaceae bacterium]|nr:ABC transporter ATP-binding protein [Actinomycetaceae bacterium]
MMTMPFSDSLRAHPVASSSPYLPQTLAHANEQNQTNLPSLATSSCAAATAAEKQDTPALTIRNLSKLFESHVAVAQVNLDIPVGAFYGIVGPNGAGKTTMLSMATGLMLPDMGQVFIHGIDLWNSPKQAKNLLGVLPDGVDTFDRLTGNELITYAGILRGLDKTTARRRAADLMRALDLADASKKMISEYSAGLTKKINLACALVHSPRILVLDEPFESVDPISAGTIIEILQKYCSDGGTIVLSSHVMATVEKLCTHVAIMDRGIIKACGTLSEVAGGRSLEDRFIELVGGMKHAEGLEWLAPSAQ